MSLMKDLTNKATLVAADEIPITNSVDLTKSYNVTGEVLKAYVSGGTAIEFIEVTGSGDDAGLICTGQWSVGRPSAPKESVFGAGDSYPVPIAYQFDQANLSGTTITSATDVSTELQDDSANTISMFGGITVGKSLLFGSDYVFPGIKLKTITAGVMNNGDIVSEFLLDDTPTWTEVNFMASDSGYPYGQYANKLANTSGQSEQIRGGFTPNVITTRSPVTLTINGAAITKYWTVLRIGTAITTDPVIQQVKCHTNRTEINAEGVVEYFGLARRYAHISKTLSDWQNTSLSPSSEYLNYADLINIYNTNNEFVNNTLDATAYAFVVPSGLDTSVDLNIEVSWYVRDNDTGDVKLNLRGALIPEDSILDGTIPSTSTEITTTITTAQPNKLIRITFTFPVAGALAGDTIALKLWRDGSDDTLEGSIILENALVSGVFWK